MRMMLRMKASSDIARIADVCFLDADAAVEFVPPEAGARLAPTVTILACGGASLVRPASGYRTYHSDPPDSGVSA